jgi:predicted lipoprotein with Yx(FWY)xxD motif
MKKTTYGFALLAALAALVIAGCGGGGSSSGSSSGSAASGGESAGGGMTVSAAEISGLGPVLVDSEGLTVYEFTEDKGTTSVCYGGCEEEWPPVIASGKPTAGEGAMAADLGTTKRKDGTVQVTYKGHPIYTFADDESPGEANGNEDDGTWFVLNEAGSAVEGKATAATGGGDGDSTEESSGAAGGGGGY